MTGNAQPVIEVEARVLRVIGELVSFDFDTWASTTVRWSGPPLTEGAVVRVRGVEDNRLTHLAHGLRIISVTMGEQTFQIATVPDDAAGSTPETLDPLIIAALKQAGLVSHDAELDAAESFAPFALQSLYADDRAAGRARGFVSFDWKWRNDSENPYAELLEVAGAAHLTARAVSPDETELDRIAAEVNEALTATPTARRLWLWDTGGDLWVFIGVTDETAKRLREAGCILSDPASDTF